MGEEGKEISIARYWFQCVTFIHSTGHSKQCYMFLYTDIIIKERVSQQTVLYVSIQILLLKRESVTANSAICFYTTDIIIKERVSQ